MIRPTGHRVLIQPDEQPEQSGDILLPQHREFVSTSGTVIAIGPRGSRIRWEARQRAIREVVELLREQGGVSSLWQNELLKLIGSPDPEHEIRVGDRVAFDSESGLRLFQDGIEYLILDEDDVVVIVEESEAVA
jgi:co-chaperonin GroES (HSP10)